MGVGGAGGVIALATGFIEPIRNHRNHLGDSVTSTLFAGVALIIAASALAVAMFVSADLRARGQASAAQYMALGAVAASFLQASTVSPKGPNGNDNVSDDELAHILRHIDKLAIGRQDLQIKHGPRTLTLHGD